MARARASALTNTQILFLKEMARHPDDGCTVEELHQAVGIAPVASVLGPVFADVVHNYPDSLYGRGLCIPQKRYDEPVRYVVTKAGKRIADTHSALSIKGADSRVPPELLDPAVRQIRPTKPYGFERYTPSDWTELRALLPDEYQTMTDVDLCEQVCNRRKQGVYADSKLPVFPMWYVTYCQSEHWLEVCGKVLRQYGGCALDPSHDKGESEVYHRRIVDSGGTPVFGRELISDCIPLCAVCRKRQGRFMCVIPDEQP